MLTEISLYAESLHGDSEVVILLGESISCQPEQQEKNVKGAEEKWSVTNIK